MLSVGCVVVVVFCLCVCMDIIRRNETLTKFQNEKKEEKTMCIFFLWFCWLDSLWFLHVVNGFEYLDSLILFWPCTARNKRTPIHIHIYVCIMGNRKRWENDRFFFVCNMCVCVNVSVKSARVCNKVCRVPFVEHVHGADQYLVSF